MSTTKAWLRRNLETGDVQISEPEQFNTARINKNDFFNIVTIVGSSKTGKSTLMNRLVENDVFKTSNSRHACTKGVCLSELKEVGGNGVVVYADTEGTGNNNINTESKLLMPVVLLSKVVIFNVRKQILVERQLRELEIFVHIGDRIKLDDRPLKFGHLIIAVSDYDFEDGTNEEVHNDYFQKEESNNNDAVKRNKIREKLLSMFQSIQVRLLRLPLNTVQNNPELEGLKNEIRNKVTEPRRIGESAHLTPGNVSRFMEDIVDKQKTNAIEMKSVVSEIQRKEVDEARNRFKDNLLAFADKLVFPERNIKEKLTQEKDKLFMKFEEETSKVDFESEYKNDVKGNLEAFFQQTSKQLNAIDKAARDFKQKLKAAFDEIKLRFKTNGDLNKSMKTLKVKYFEIFDQNTKEIDLQLLKRKEDIRKDLESFCNKEEERMLQLNAVVFKDDVIKYSKYGIGSVAVIATVGIGGSIVINGTASMVASAKAMIGVPSLALELGTSASATAVGASAVAGSLGAPAVACSAGSTAVACSAGSSAFAFSCGGAASAGAVGGNAVAISICGSASAGAIGGSAIAINIPAAAIGNVVTALTGITIGGISQTPLVSLVDFSTHKLVALAQIKST